VATPSSADSKHAICVSSESRAPSTRPQRLRLPCSSHAGSKAACRAAARACGDASWHVSCDDRQTQQRASEHRIVPDHPSSSMSAAQQGRMPAE
jgi:hypothetical protein